MNSKFRRVRYILLLMQLRWFYTSRDFRRARVVSKNLSGEFGHADISFWLIRCRMEILSGHRQDARLSLGKFYQEAKYHMEGDEQPYRATSEGKWMLCFAEYMLLMLSGAGVTENQLDPRFHVSDLEGIDFEEVGGFIKTYFSPDHKEDIKKLMHEE